MFPRQIVTFVLTSILVLAAAASAGGAPPEPPIATAGPITLPYSATLTALAGQPVEDGLYDLRFALYDAAEGGKLLWSEAQSGILVKSGNVGAALGLVNPLPGSLFAGGSLWLAVAVRGPGETTFDALSPRQEVTPAAPEGSPAPVALGALSCAHTHIGEWWSGSYPAGPEGYAFQVQNNSTGDAIRGLSNSTDTGYAGVYGNSLGTGAGVYGYSSNGVGVRAESYNNAALLAQSSGHDGIRAGTSATGRSGIYAHHDGAAGQVGWGVYGVAGNGNGVGAVGNDDSATDQLADVVLYGTRGEILALSDRLNLASNSDVNVVLDTDNGSTATFTVWNGDGEEVFWVTENGTMRAFGPKTAVVQTDTAGPRALYAVESTGVWFEDSGTAALVDGKAEVKIDDVFLHAISPSAGYQVFLTPLGDCNGLYVAAKDAGSFTVRELGGGRSNVSFDWRLAAKRRGYETARMEQVNEAGEKTP